MSQPELILHIGAPKCGSSALQTAFSRTPVLKDADGRVYKYSSVSRLPTGSFDVNFGAQLTRKADASLYGYASWPNLSKQTPQQAVFDAITSCKKTGAKEGFTPILSSEGWINHPELFAEYFKEQNYPQVDVVAFLRAPVDWVNAAFWQWGTWVCPDLDVWLDRSGMNYNFAEMLKAWSKIPNVRLHVRRPQPDVVVKFSEIFGLDAPAIGLTNTASSAVLIGFLMRNRTYRKDGHDAGTEFVVQRWCPATEARRPWAIAARHVHRMRETCAQTMETLEEILPEHELNDLLIDRKWSQEQAYHSQILAGGSPVDDPAALTALHGSLLAGASAASMAAGLKGTTIKDTALHTCPDVADSIEVWDAALCLAMDALLAADQAYRSEVQVSRFRGVLKRVLRV